MKYKPYEVYKDSGIEWIGDIPQVWEVKKLKYLCELRNEKTSDENREYIALEHIESMTGRIIKKKMMICSLKVTVFVFTKMMFCFVN